MSSPWKNGGQPDLVVDKVLKRAEVGKIGRELKTRLALAQFKTSRGWEHLTLDTIEPKVEEELKRRRPTSSGDIRSNSSSTTASTTSELRYTSTRRLMSSPLKAPAIFSDQVGSRSRSGSSSGHRKRNYHNSFEYPSSGADSRKRFRSSPTPGRISTKNQSWKNHYSLAQSSPIKARKHAHFTTSSGPGVSFYQGTSHLPDDLHSFNFAAPSDDEEDSLPVHSFNHRSSPPRTPSPVRNRSFGRRNKEKSGKSGEEGADLLLYLATSPSPAKPNSRARMQPPSTPPPKKLDLPSSMMNTPGGGGGLLSVFPHTPSQAFDFSDFVNITPSPGQGAFRSTPRSAKTPLTVTRRRLTFENFLPPSSPSMRDNSSMSRHQGLGMQLGGDLLP